MNNKIPLESMAMDLKRVALGYNRNSLVMAQRFYEEALKRRQELDMRTIKPYLHSILDKIETLQKQSNEKIADDALMYSTLIQNYTRNFSI